MGRISRWGTVLDTGGILVVERRVVARATTADRVGRGAVSGRLVGLAKLHLGRPGRSRDDGGGGAGSGQHPPPREACE